MTGVRIEGDYLEFEASIDEDVVSVEEVLDDIEEIRAEFKEEVTLHLYDYFDESDELLRLVVKEGKGMRLVFVFEKSGVKLMLLEFTPRGAGGSRADVTPKSHLAASAPKNRGKMENLHPRKRGVFMCTSEICFTGFIGPK